MSAFMKTMAYVGDLDDAFYDDERQRDVWNEASAVGLQLYIWASMIVAAVLPWVAGRPGAWVCVGLLISYAVIGNATVAYAKRRNVDMQVLSSYRRPRLIAVIALYLVAALGAVLALMPGVQVSDSTRTGAAVGGVMGAVIGAVAAAVGIRRARRNAALLESTDEL